MVLKNTNLNPRHVMLLHFLHFFLNTCVQFTFKFQRLHMIHVSVAIKQVSLQSRPRFLLCIPCHFCILGIEPITVVPASAMGFPWAKAHPTKFSFAILIFANHVIATAIFLDGDITFGTLFCVRCNPIRCFRIIVTLLYPLF